MEYVGPLFDVQRLRDLASRVLPRLPNHGAGMRVAAPGNLVGDVLHLEEMRLRTEIGNERAASRDAFNVAFIVQLSQCADDGQPRIARAAR